MEDLKSLIQKRDEIEEEIESTSSELKGYSHLNYDKELVDREGFPRDDLDFGKLQEYKKLKKRLNELLYDFKELTKEIEVKMLKFHEDTREEAEIKMREMEEEKKKKEMEEEEENDNFPLKNENIEENIGNYNPKMEEEDEETFPPFCKIVEVKISSPADKAGLRPGDLLIRYGKVTSLNHNELKALVDVTKSFFEKEIQVRVKRGEEEVDFVVVPREWEGPGILGCRFEVL